jgi:hypothetical protein
MSGLSFTGRTLEMKFHRSTKRIIEARGDCMQGQIAIWAALERLGYPGAGPQPKLDGVVEKAEAVQDAIEALMVEINLFAEENGEHRLA